MTAHFIKQIEFEIWANQKIAEAIEKLMNLAEGVNSLLVFVRENYETNLSVD